MKNKSTNRFKNVLVTLTLLLIITVNGYSQTGYVCIIKNITFTDSKTLHFDVFIENAGSTTLSLQAFQAGVNVTNYDSLVNGGVLTASFLQGSSSTALPAKQQSLNWKFNSVSHSLQMFASIVTPLADATVIPSASTGGIKLGTCEIKNTTDFTSGITPDLSWSFSAASATSTKTVITCYVDGSEHGTNITSTASHIVVH